MFSRKAFSTSVWRRLLSFLLLLLAPVAWGSFSQETLLEILQKNPKTDLPVQSIQELIPLLPRELRENFTFVYQSRSPFAKSISPLYPRVILFTKDARQILTFTGDPEKSGFNYLETMSFQDDTAEFKLNIYPLPAAKLGDRSLSHETTTCARCHGADARPIYDSYPLWPGFYGSIQDTFPPQSKVGREELQNYQKFLAGNARTGVYEKLIYTKQSPVPPFLDPARFVPDKVEADLNDFRFLPNTRLGIALTELNRKRIYRKLKQSPQFQKQKLEILSELLDCNSKRTSDSRAAEIQAELKAENVARLKRLGSDPQDPAERVNDMQELKFFRELEQIDWVSRILGVGREDWSMALEPNSLSYFDGVLSGIYKGQSYYLKEDLIFEILQDLSTKNPRVFKKYFGVITPYLWLSYPFGNRPSLEKAKKLCSDRKILGLSRL